MAIPVDNAPALPHALGFFNDAPSSTALLLSLWSRFSISIVINLPSQQPLVCRTYLYLPLSAPWPIQSNTSETIFKSATTPRLPHQPRTHSRTPARTRSIAKGKSRGPPGQRIRWDRLPPPRSSPLSLWSCPDISAPHHSRAPFISISSLDSPSLFPLPPEVPSRNKVPSPSLVSFQGHHRRR